MIAINQTVLPTPSALNVQVQTQSGQVRFNSAGEKLLEGQREKSTVEMVWNQMETSTLTALAQVLQPGGFFTLTYPDPLNGQRQISCHVTERSAQVFSLRSGETRWCQVRLKMEER